jgi:hypothetical protein
MLNSEIILRGWRNPRHCLWRVRIVNNSWTTNIKVMDNNSTPQSSTVAHSLYDCDNTQQLIQFYHACLFSQVISTLTNAINRGYLKGFPGLNSQRVRRHIKINNATKKGHMDQSCQGKRSTSSSAPTSTPTFTSLDDTTDNILPIHIEEGLTNLVFVVIHEISGEAFTNQTGCFPITSNHGHAYLVIFYIYDANFIASIPIKNHTKEELL